MFPCLGCCVWSRVGAHDELMWYVYKLSLTMRPHLDSDSILTATVGIASPVLGVITSFQEQIEWTLRVASLIVGLMVGAMSLIAMVKKMRGK